MRLSTKTLASLLLATAVAATVPGITKIPGRVRRHGSQFDRLLQRHDRKGELRAEILGISAADFRAKQKKHSFDEIARARGFSNARAFSPGFYFGKLKQELHQKGWSSGRIDKFVTARAQIV